MIAFLAFISCIFVLSLKLPLILSNIYQIEQMQKYLFLFSFALLAFACGPGSSKGSREGERVLTVTIEPQRYFLDRIVGNAFTINTLVPVGTSPETYEPAPSVMVNMGKSEIYFMVGDLGFERAWSQRLAENNPEVLIVNCSDGVERMEGHEHHHDEGDAHHHHHHDGMDPHVWSSPKAVKLFTRNMLEAVVNADPGNEEIYRENYRQLLGTIERTDSTIQTLLDNAKGRSFIIYHPALGYFARDYGLSQLSIEFEGKNPSPSQIKELVDIARAEKVNTIFVQMGFDKKNAEVIAQEINGEIFVIDPLAYEWDEELIRIASILSREPEKK